MSATEQKTVLLAVPDVGRRPELVRLLEDEGLVVLEAHEGGRALDAVRRAHPDLAVIDLRLARPAGIEVVRRIVAGREGQQTRIIILAAKADDATIAEAFAAGAVDVCEGASRPREFVARVRARLRLVVGPPTAPVARPVGDAVDDPARLVTSPGFVERLVDSSGDAIIAADRQGTILLFNRAAERVTGFLAADIVGTMNVRDIYPEGVAYDIMTKLRSPDYGGVGRAGPLSAEIIASDGEAIPIQLHASVLYGPAGEELATVGFFSDLRARREIEKKLAEAQEQLISAEKQAAVSELAGSAAHELNQPLAGIMGLAELALRRLPEGHPARETCLAIQEEVERMAAVVRKIGRITHYETQSYVGKQRIVDLDRSSE